MKDERKIVFPASAESESADLLKMQAELQNIDRFKETGRGAGLEVAIEIEPAEADTATGDFVNVERLEDGRISIFIGDVEGHGDAAARVTIALHKFMESPAFRDAENKDAHAADVLEFLDKNMPLGRERTLTLAHVLLDPETGEIEYANAGVRSPNMLILRNGNVEVPQSFGMYIGGGYSGHHAPTTSLILGEADTVVLMTDGITEARYKDGKMVGDSVKDLLVAAAERNMSPQEIIEYIKSQIEKFDDDRTMLVLRKARSAE